MNNLESQARNVWIAASVFRGRQTLGIVLPEPVLVCFTQSRNWRIARIAEDALNSTQLMEGSA